MSLLPMAYGVLLGALVTGTVTMILWMRQRRIWRDETRLGDRAHDYWREQAMRHYGGER